MSYSRSLSCAPNIQNDNNDNDNNDNEGNNNDNDGNDNDNDSNDNDSNDNAMLTAMLEMTATAKRKMEDVDIRGKRIGKWSQPLKIISLPCQMDVLRFHQ